MSYSSGFGQDGGAGTVSQLDCMQQGKWYFDGECLSTQEYSAVVCADQLGGIYNPATGACEMKAGTGLSEVAEKAACEAMQGAWDADTKSCALPTTPPTPGQPPGPSGQGPPPGEQDAGVPWKPLGFIAVGLTGIYLLVRSTR